jgi:hypothetical protein
VGKLTETALGALKDPKAAAGKVVDQARGTAALGRMVAEQVGRSAVSTATGTASTVIDRVRTRGAARTSEPVPTAGAADQRADRADLRAVPTVNEPGHPPAGRSAAEPASTAPAAKAPVKRAASAKKQGDPVQPTAPKAATTSSTEKAPTTKSTTKSPAAKAGRNAATPPPSDVAEAAEARAERPEAAAATPSARKTATKKAASRPSAKSATKKAGTKKAGAKKAPAKRPTAKKAGSGPGDKLPPRKEAATTSTSATGATEPTPEQRTATENAEGTSGEVTTPVGTTGAGEATNPSTAETDLNQPGTEPIVDPSTTKQVASETEQLRKAAEQEK